MVEDRVDMVLGKEGRSYPDARGLYKTPSLSCVHKSLHGIWWVLELFPHRYYDKDYGFEFWRIPLGVRRELPDGALLHSSVVQRMSNPREDYHPTNLLRGQVVRSQSGQEFQNVGGPSTTNIIILTEKNPIKRILTWNLHNLIPNAATITSAVKIADTLYSTKVPPSFVPPVDAEWRRQVKVLYMELKITPEVSGDDQWWNQLRATILHQN